MTFDELYIVWRQSVGDLEIECDTDASVTELEIAEAGRMRLIDADVVAR